MKDLTFSLKTISHITNLACLAIIGLIVYSAVTTGQWSAGQILILLAVITIFINSFFASLFLMSLSYKAKQAESMVKKLKK